MPGAFAAGPVAPGWSTVIGGQPAYLRLRAGPDGEPSIVAQRMGIDGMPIEMGSWTLRDGQVVPMGGSDNGELSVGSSVGPGPVGTAVSSGGAMGTGPAVVNGQVGDGYTALGPVKASNVPLAWPAAPILTAPALKPNAVAPPVPVHRTIRGGSVSGDSGELRASGGV